MTIQNKKNVMENCFRKGDRKKEKNLLSYYGFTKADQKKYPVVASILRQLTPERIKKGIEEIRKVELPPELQRWVGEYKKAGGERDDIIWQFVYLVIRNISPFINYNKKYKKINMELKFLFSMFIIIIDDIADKEKNDKLFNEITKIIYYNLKDGNTKELNEISLFAIDIYRHIYKQIKQFPFFSNYENLLEFETVQIFNSMKYSIVVNKYPFIINELEFWNYFPCSMQIMLYYIIELMCITSKHFEEYLQKSREIILIIQKMGRIGNCLSTWRRELDEKDFTSLVFFSAVEKGIIKIKDIENINTINFIEKIEKLGVESDILARWNYYFNIVKNKKRLKNNLINKKNLLKRVEKLLTLQLIANC